MNGESLDITKGNIDKLKKIFPEIVTDGQKIDFEKLKTVLGEEVDGEIERYSFNWYGKKKTIIGAQTPSKGTLRPDKEKSKNFDTTENLYIEGDNLEVLKLLQKTYNNKIKVIYIDPPYNTGKDFVYKDNFRDGVGNYLEQTGQTDNEGNRITTNSESNGRYHTDWLNMIYPRLKLSKNLLSDDGVILISIDDNEEANLIKICDELFGEFNKIAHICVKSRASISNDKIISPNHNRLIAYAKNIEILSEKKSKIGIEPNLEGFNLSDNKGNYKLVPVDGPGGAKKGNPYYNFLGIEGYFRFSYDTMMKKYQNDELVIKEEKIYQKHYLEDAKRKRRTVSTWWDDVSLTSTATTKLKKLMEIETFDTPKPIELLNKIFQMFAYENKDAVILDFFSGSATTAHATMQLNAEDGGNRRFIMIQLPEQLDEKSEAYKDGYRTICDIGEERIRRAGKLVKQELIEKNAKDGMLADDIVDPEQLDIGFKVLKLDKSNIREWNSDFENLEDNLFAYEDVFVEGRSELDVVYEIMLKNGLELTYTVNQFEYEGKNVYDIAYGNLFVCLADNIDVSVAQAIVEKRNEYGIDTSSVVFKDTGFKNDADKLNVIELLKDSGYPEENILTI
ncbi:site-specific DNA-methyltransferase [Macrococcoides canis]|uniref:site-specific DNA-methyltransferase n=1 Tax=Macrococcoides canis TaxID=1855823 RepID=UPI0020B814C9|nr:site-specific DNA-methyltransferase [Macrococcus canis]